MDIAYRTILALGLAAALAALLEDKERSRAAPARWLGWVLLALLGARTMDWLAMRGALAPFELPPAVPLSRSSDHILFQVIVGAFGFGLARSGARAALEGAVCGLIFAAFGFCAAHWLAVAQAWRLIGWFSGTFLVWTLPLWLALTCALSAAALLSPDLAPVRARVTACLLILWYAGAVLAQSRLEANWDFGPRSLSEAAGLPAATESPALSVAWLKPSASAPYRVEPLRAELSYVNASQESLVKLYQYFESRGYKSIFWRQGIRVLRQGWLLWWDSDRALKAASLSVPGLFPPDYRMALNLVKAGPETQTRLGALQSLAERAKPRKEGFEDVTGSQYIFEGFSGAYARFGNEDQARWWLLKIDNLWPIYEKKIEVTQVESMHDGEVDGSVLLSSVPAEGLVVGLFYLGTSTTSEVALSSGALSDSVLADAQGRFKFSYLGPGRYFLALLGAPQDLEGRIHDSPGLIELSRDNPVARLPPIIIERPGEGFHPPADAPPDPPPLPPEPLPGRG